MSLWAKVARTVAAHAEHDDIQEAIGNAAFLFEKSHAHQAGDDYRGDNLGWTDEVDAEPVDFAARDRLRDTLVAFVKRRPDDLNCGSAYWALGKLHDSSLRDLYAEALEYYLNAGEPTVLFQVLIALDNIGERIFEGVGGSGSNEYEKNERLARNYLSRRDK